jgi:hypothetical protein
MGRVCAERPLQDSPMIVRIGEIGDCDETHH